MVERPTKDELIKAASEMSGADWHEGITTVTRRAKPP
jgi:hypothetical protein